MRCVASQLSVPAIGFMCSDQRQPGSHVPAIAEWSPIFTTWTSPFPDSERVSSGCFAFLISSPMLPPREWYPGTLSNTIERRGGWGDGIPPGGSEPALFGGDSRPPGGYVGGPAAA